MTLLKDTVGCLTIVSLGEGLKSAITSTQLLLSLMPDVETRRGRTRVSTRPGRLFLTCSLQAGT
jgi:hypothetical protein